MACPRWCTSSPCGPWPPTSTRTSSCRWRESVGRPSGSDSSFRTSRSPFERATRPRRSGGGAGRRGPELPAPPVAVRTGDTPAAERVAMRKSPPNLLVTTPESLYLLLTAASSRSMLRGVRTVIVDEVHTLARDKRGSHLSLSLERLDGLVAES